jgi:SOS-response transcriptional repressor LexA
MTPLQHRCLDMISSYITEKGYSPSYDEIAEALSTSKSRVFEVVAALVEQGHLVRTADKQRNLRLPMPDDALMAQLLAALLPFKNTMPLVRHERDDAAIEHINTDLAVDDIKRAAAAYDSLRAELERRGT